MSSLAKKLALRQKLSGGFASAQLGYAPQRMSSTQKPLARACINMEAIIALAHEVVRTRSDKPKQQAQEFLDQLTPHRLLLLGLLADSGDEVASVVRFFDTKGYDLAAVPTLLHTFISRVDELFVKGKVFTTSRSYVSHMMRFLENKKVLVHSSTGIRVLGGSKPPHDQCHKLMAAWAALAIQQLQVQPSALQHSSMAPSALSRYLGRIPWDRYSSGLRGFQSQSPTKAVQMPSLHHEALRHIQA